MTSPDRAVLGMRRSVGDVVALFVGRLGGLALNLLFLPLYDAALGPGLFGMVALVLSLQAFFLVFDFGFASLLGAEAAQAGDDPVRRAEVAADWRLTARVLPASGLIAGTAAAMLWAVSPGDSRMVSALDLLLVAMMVALMMQTNAGQAVLNARAQYRIGSALSLGGALGRGVAALAAIHLFGPGFTNFVGSQLAVVAVQQGVQSWQLHQILGPAGPWQGRLLPLLERLKPLMAYGLAGALLMQVDKPLVGVFFSLEAAGRWFLAMTYALTPIALLAGPLHQYFFPRLAAALDQPADALRIATLFQMATVLAAAAPSVVLAWHAPLLVSIWLPHAPDASLIASLAQPMVTAAAIGAMGYLPTAYLVASGDRAWLAWLSWTMLPCVAAGLLLAAANESLRGLALVYSLYHVAACLLLWARMLKAFPVSGSRLSLIGNAWLLPMAGCVVPVLALLLLLDRAGVPPIPSLFAASAIGAVAMASVALRWWLRYRRAACPSDNPTGSR